VLINEGFTWMRTAGASPWRKYDYIALELQWATRKKM